MKGQRTLLNYRSRRELSYWLMLIPFLLGFAVVYLGIYVSSLVFSFQKIELLQEGGFSQTWNGLGNYRYILTEEPGYRTSLMASVGQMLLFTLFIVIFSLFIAVLLNRRMAGRGFFRAMFFIPVILATGFVAKADMYSMLMQSMQMGVEAADTAAGSTSMFSARDIRDILFSLSFSPMLSEYVLTAVNSIVDIINGSGVQILIFLAGLQSISAAIYESANIDGATGWESFWLITFPMISPLILVNVVYSVIDSLTKPSNAIMLLIEEYRAKSGHMGTASAMAWFYFLVVMIALAVITAVISTYVYYQQKD